MRPHDGKERRGPPVAGTFFGVTYAWTWSLWWTAAATAGSLAEPAGAPLYMAAVTGAAVTVPPYGVGAIGGAIAVALLAGLAEEPGWRGTQASTSPPPSRRAARRAT